MLDVQAKVSISTYNGRSIATTPTNLDSNVITISNCQDNDDMLLVTVPNLGTYGLDKMELYKAITMCADPFDELRFYNGRQ